MRPSRGAGEQLGEGGRGRLGAGPPGTSNPSHGEATGEAHVVGRGSLCQVRCQSRAAGPVETESVRKTGAGAVGRSGCSARDFLNAPFPSQGGCLQAHEGDGENLSAHEEGRVA